MTDLAAEEIFCTFVALATVLFWLAGVPIDCCGAAAGGAAAGVAWVLLRSSEGGPFVANQLNLSNQPILHLCFDVPAPAHSCACATVYIEVGLSAHICCGASVQRGIH